MVQQLVVSQPSRSVICEDGVTRTFTQRPRTTQDNGFVRVGNKTVSGYRVGDRFYASSRSTNKQLAGLTI